MKLLIKTFNIWVMYFTVVDRYILANAIIQGTLFSSNNTVMSHPSDWVVAHKQLLYWYFMLGVLLSISLLATHCVIKIIQKYFIFHHLVCVVRLYLWILDSSTFCCILEGCSYPVLVIYPSMNKAMKMLCYRLVSTS